MQHTANLVIEECCNCHMLFAMTREFQKRAKDRPGPRHQNPNAITFYCPAGHAQYYAGETEADKLRRENQRLKQNEAYLADRERELRRQRDHERARANGHKGYATKLRKRAKAGVCPCCNRHFTALEQHMRTQHPDFQAEPEEV